MRTPTAHLALTGQKVLIQFPEFMGGLPHTVVTTIGGEIKFSLRTKVEEIAAFRRSIANAELEKVFATATKQPQPLNHKQLRGLAGAIHELYVEAFQDEPGTKSVWVAHKALNRAISEGRIRDIAPIVPGKIDDERDLADSLFGADLTSGINALPTSIGNLAGLERRFGLLADWLLTQNGLKISGETRGRLLLQISKGTDTGARRLKDNIDGDYGPDARQAQYPVFVGSGRSFTQVFAQWKGESSPSASTLTSWRGVFTSLREHLGHDDVSRVQKVDVVGWKDALVQKGLAAKTINQGHLAALNSLLNYEVQNGRLETNVATGVRAHAGSNARLSRLAYSREDAGKLLSLARAETHPNLRWLPWLAAMTGARIGEIAQLFGKHVKTLDGITIIEITPTEDGGRLKNEWSERKVPLHPSILAQGFLDFVASRGDGPLFYKKTSGNIEKAHASKSVSNRISVWVRKQTGFQDPRKAPNHAFRHWFKTELGGLGVQDSVADALMGHGSSSVADQYRHYTVSMLFDAVKKLPDPTATTNDPKNINKTQNDCRSDDLRT